jgi:DNA-binding transcriptional ArsR family regulator
MAAEERQQDHDEDKVDTHAEMAPGKARVHKELFADPRIATFEDYLEQFEAIANSTRFIILYLLSEDGETTYKELSEATEKVGNGLNHHLDTLQSAGLITRYKQRIDGQERSVYELSVLGSKLVEPTLEFIAEEGELAEQYV